MGTTETRAKPCTPTSMFALSAVSVEVATESAMVGPNISTPVHSSASAITMYEILMQSMKTVVFYRNGMGIVTDS